MIIRVPWTSIGGMPKTTIWDALQQSQSTMVIRSWFQAKAYVSRSPRNAPGFATLSTPQWPVGEDSEQIEIEIRVHIRFSFAAVIGRIGDGGLDAYDVWGARCAIGESPFGGESHEGAMQAVPEGLRHRSGAER